MMDVKDSLLPGVNVKVKLSAFAVLIVYMLFLQKIDNASM